MSSARTTSAQEFVVEPDGDEVEIRASLRGDDEDWGGYLIGPADWVGIASSTEPFFELRLPDGRSGACFVSEFDQAATDQRVTISRGWRRAVCLTILSHARPVARDPMDTRRPIAVATTNPRELAVDFCPGSSNSNGMRR